MTAIMDEMMYQDQPLATASLASSTAGSPAKPREGKKVLVSKASSLSITPHGIVFRFARLSNYAVDLTPREREYAIHKALTNHEALGSEEGSVLAR